MAHHDLALDDSDGAPACFASGAPPQPACPCCGHVRSVRSLAEAVSGGPRPKYSRIWDIFGPEFRPNGGLQVPTVTNALHELGYPAPPVDRRRLGIRSLAPPRRPWTMGQALDRRLTVVIDLAFLGLALFLLGRLIRAAELLALAALLAVLVLVLAVWFAVALATGQFRRANGAAQARYEGAARRWRSLRYCEDCGHAFRADGPGYLLPQEVPAYLVSDGTDRIPPSTGH